MATTNQTPKTGFNDFLKASGEVGFVESSVLSVVEVEGLPNVKYGEMVMFESGHFGQVMGLKPESVEILVFARETVKTGTRVTRMGRKLSIPVGEGLLGKTIDVLGRTISGGPTGKVEEWRTIDATPGGIGTRVRVDRPLTTGVMVVDLLVPLGKGQRELVLGDRKTGKSFLLNQAVKTQAKEGNICIYAAVGKQKSEIKKVEDFLARNGITGQTVVVAASSEDSSGEVYMCPYSAMTIAEYFRDKGRDVLLVMDDMSTHAKFYRELSLISRKFPGRDSYPGDIFHIHSKLMERAGYFKVGDKAAAITCLPVVETAQGDISGYIPTNMMSMTDGHVYFDSEMFFKGRRPAVNPFVSVTRVGRQTQTALQRDAGRNLLDLLNSYEKTQSFLKFGAELGESSRQILAMGEKIIKFFDQPMSVVVPMPVQLILLCLLLSGVWNGEHLEKLVEAYSLDAEAKKAMDEMVARNDTLNKLMEEVRRSGDYWLSKLTA